ncbi:hypothetical protein F5Y12DRAFT_661069 [Xylaria sp. FL1777]|nr:hypothetical protein F5Y12DRAFT_661069 [Xylaria sp. FL1777]
MAPTQYQHVYPLENEEEVGRLRNQHDVIKDAMDGLLILAPVDLSTSPLRILDSGTADGTWIRDLAATCASLEHRFYGTDINPTDFPANPPEGTVYQIQDVNKPWPADWKESFDFVHQRLVLVAAGSTQREALQSLGELVKPGGWIQLIEATNVLPEDSGPVMHSFVKVMNAVFDVMGADLAVTEKIPQWLEEAGFVDVHEKTVPMNLGAVNRDPTLASRGVFSTSAAATGLSKFAKTLPAGAAGMPIEKLDTLGADLQGELMKLGAVYPLRVVWGRKAT